MFFNLPNVNIIHFCYKEGRGSLCFWYILRRLLITSNYFMTNIMNASTSINITLLYSDTASIT